MWHINGRIRGDISRKNDLATDIARYIAISEGYESILHNELPFFEIEVIENDANNYIIAPSK
jgi:hypothetical protein